MTEKHPMADLRQQIDALDDQIIDLLATRYALLAQVVKVKAAHNISHHVESRVQEVLNRTAQKGAERGLPETMMRRIYTAIIDAAHEYESQFLPH